MPPSMTWTLPAASRFRNWLLHSTGAPDARNGGAFSDKVLVGAPRPGARDSMISKPRIAHISGSNATISGSPPLVTSNKAREKRGLHLLEDASGARLRFDALRAQRLAAPVTVYVEQFSAHPLERDAAELYGPPDGYVDR